MAVGDSFIIMRDGEKHPAWDEALIRGVEGWPGRGREVVVGIDGKWLGGRICSVGPSSRLIPVAPAYMGGDEIPGGFSDAVSKGLYPSPRSHLEYPFPQRGISTSAKAPAGQKPHCSETVPAGPWWYLEPLNCMRIGLITIPPQICTLFALPVPSPIPDLPPAGAKAISKDLIIQGLGGISEHSKKVSSFVLVLGPTCGTALI